MVVKLFRKIYIRKKLRENKSFFFFHKILINVFRYCCMENLLSRLMKYIIYCNIKHDDIVTKLVSSRYDTE